MTRRKERLGDLIRDEISTLLQRQANDPRLSKLVSITEVTLSPDLKRATVFVSILGSEEEQREVMEGLGAAKRFFRRELGSRLTMRQVPELDFHQDDSIERGARLLQLMKEVTSHDRDE